MAAHVMLIPSLSCPAKCAYCFGPNDGGAPMCHDIVDAAIRWADGLRNGNLEIVFHGGEPLAAGKEYYTYALPRLREAFGQRRLSLSMQSNLWLMTEEICALFVEHGVSVGTSLDGPEEITDAQRGEGYFRQTMAGIELARSKGLDVGCICTFTSESALRWEEIFEFFLQEGLHFSVHAAVPPLEGYEDEAERQWRLGPADFGELTEQLFGKYLTNLSRIKISSLDHICGSVSAAEGRVCTFRDCLGDYLAVAPDGFIHPCQRFAGNQRFQLGNVLESPTVDDLARSPVWREFREREERVAEECGECEHFAYCRGGCPYNALAAGGGEFKNLRDPYCPAYKRGFAYVVERALSEVFSDENLNEVVEKPGSSLLRKGAVVSLMRGRPHPFDAAQQARRVLAAVALAGSDNPASAASKLRQLGVLTRVEGSLSALYSRLTKPPAALNNLYLHVTFQCNLQCAHCYAEARPDRTGHLPIADVIRACGEASELGFRHAVITGGEPLVHPMRDELLDALKLIRAEVKPLLTVLRTNLCLQPDASLIRKVSESTDEVVVSVDGDRDTHDKRRGAGSYDLTVRNLRALMACGGTADVSLAAVLPAREATGQPGESVRALAAELGIRRTRFRPLLPIGRAAESDLDIVPEALWAHLEPGEMLEYGFSPTNTCGMGQNLFVRPDGAAFPCYAWCGEEWLLGSIADEPGLRGVIDSHRFKDLGRHTVDTNRLCRECVLRYLCGGACRAWSGAHCRRDLDAPPQDCSHLRKRAVSLLLSALRHLDVSERDWLRAGLPLPDMPSGTGVPRAYCPPAQPTAKAGCWQPNVEYVIGQADQSADDAESHIR